MGRAYISRGDGGNAPGRRYAPTCWGLRSTAAAAFLALVSMAA
jgi:hypothetical protein